MLVKVKAIPDETIPGAAYRMDDEDLSVVGTWFVELDDDVPAENIGDVALDVFHSQIAVNDLECFSFEVYKDGVLMPLADEWEWYSGKDRGYIIGKEGQ